MNQHEIISAYWSSPVTAILLTIILVVAVVVLYLRVLRSSRSSPVTTSSSKSLDHNLGALFRALPRVVILAIIFLAVLVFMIE